MISPRLRIPLASLALALVACGPSTPAAEHAGHEEEHHGAEHGEHHEHGDLPGPVHDFHEALAPLWHADKGADRVAKTCTQALALHDKAGAIETAPVPEHADAASWKADAAALTAATRQLAAECEKEGRPEFEARFAAVHEGFHKLAERLEH